MHFFLCHVAFEYRSQTVWFFWATILFDEINRLLQVPHICVPSVELIAGGLVIVAVWHSTNHNHERCIWQLWEVSSHCFARTHHQISRRTLVHSPSLLPRLLNLICRFLQNHHNQLSPNPCGILKIFLTQPGLETLQNICNCHLRVQGSISPLFQMGLSPDNGPMLLVQKSSQPYFLPLVECTKVGLPHPCGKLLQGEFRLLQAEWGFAFSPAQVRRIIPLIICIKFVTRNLW